MSQNKQPENASQPEKTEKSEKTEKTEKTGPPNLLNKFCQIRGLPLLSQLPPSQSEFTFLEKQQKQYQQMIQGIAESVSPQPDYLYQLYPFYNFEQLQKKRSNLSLIQRGVPSWYKQIPKILATMYVKYKSFLPKYAKRQFSKYGVKQFVAWEFNGQCKQFNRQVISSLQRVILKQLKITIVPSKIKLTNYMYKFIPNESQELLTQGQKEALINFIKIKYGIQKVEINGVAMIGLYKKIRRLAEEKAEKERIEEARVLKLPWEERKKIMDKAFQGTPCNKSDYFEVYASDSESEKSVFKRVDTPESSPSHSN